MGLKHEEDNFNAGTSAFKEKKREVLGIMNPFKFLWKHSTKVAAYSHVRPERVWIITIAILMEIFQMFNMYQEEAHKMLWSCFKDDKTEALGA